MATAGGFTFTAAVRVIDRVHSYAANFRASAHPARASGFTEADVFVFLVSDLSDRRHTNYWHASDFARRHSELRHIAFFSNDLRESASRANELSAFCPVAIQYYEPAFQAEYF
jgi:hypothetical protein